MNYNEMGSLNMTEKGFGYEMCNECLMKFIPFEWATIDAVNDAVIFA